MKSLVYWSLIILILFLLSCKNDNPTEPGGSTSNGAIATTTIGTEGGKLESSDFELNIPQGAFNENVELKLFELTNDDSFEDSRISNLFKVEGIPNDFTQPIKIKI